MLGSTRINAITPLFRIERGSALVDYPYAQSSCPEPIPTSLGNIALSSKFAYPLAQNIFNLALKLLLLCDCIIAAMEILPHPLHTDQRPLPLQ
jgi:hypothetical protein